MTGFNDGGRVERCHISLFLWSGCLVIGCFRSSSITFDPAQKLPSIFLRIDGVIANVFSVATVYPLRIATDIVPLGNCEWEMISSQLESVSSDRIGGRYCTKEQ